MKEEPKQDLEKEMFELEQELDIPSHLRWHNSKPKQETTLEEFIKKQLSLGKYQDQESAIRHSIELGAKWQQEHSNINALNFEIDALKKEIEVLKHQQEQDKNKYSEEEVLKFGQWLSEFNNLDNESEYVIKELLRRFKNK